MDKDKQTVLLPSPEPNYVKKSLGMLVRFAGGKNIHMNRVTRRKNGLYGNRLRVVRGPR